MTTGHPIIASCIGLLIFVGLWLWFTFTQTRSTEADKLKKVIARRNASNWTKEKEAARLKREEAIRYDLAVRAEVKARMTCLLNEAENAPVDTIQLVVCRWPSAEDSHVKFKQDVYYGMLEAMKDLPWSHTGRNNEIVLFVELKRNLNSCESSLPQTHT